MAKLGAPSVERKRVSEERVRDTALYAQNSEYTVVDRGGDSPLQL